MTGVQTCALPILSGRGLGLDLDSFGKDGHRTTRKKHTPNPVAVICLSLMVQETAEALQGNSVTSV